jgi:predicted type IV restriction endonuclease
MLYILSSGTARNIVRPYFTKKKGRGEEEEEEEEEEEKDRRQR